MGILNVTPDSFSDGGRYRDAAHAVDVGAGADRRPAPTCSTSAASRRGRARRRCPPSEERRRVLPVVAALASRRRVPISIDTYKAEVAAAALDAGAAIVNDVSGLRYEPALARGRGRARRRASS